MNVTIKLDMKVRNGREARKLLKQIISSDLRIIRGDVCPDAGLPFGMIHIDPENPRLGMTKDCRPDPRLPGYYP